MSLRIESLKKRYGDTLAVDGVSLELAPAETLALLGPSGCGKSTLLRLIAGLEPPDTGRVLLNGNDITELPPQRRNFGMVFQDYALFPHLNVAANVAFGLVELGWPRNQRRRRVSELLELVGLAGFERRRVQELSGGQQQRVALARALAPEPALLLLDEPLSNLDQTLRETLKMELKGVLTTLEMQAIYVTHDQSEAVTMGRRVAVMREGKLEQLEARDALMSAPRNTWVARFLGGRNLFDRAALAGAPNLAVEGPALLRSDLITLGGDIEAEVVRFEAQGSLRQLELFVPIWGVTVHWEGFAREVPPDLATGSPLTLTVPEEAWVPLEAS